MNDDNKDLDNKPTTSSGTSADNNRSISSETFPTSGVSETDLILANDSTATQNFTYVETCLPRHKFYALKILIIFNVVFGGSVLIFFFLSIKPLLYYIFSIPNQVGTAQHSIQNPLFLGVVSSILATIAVLITREIYYYLRDILPAGALFRGIARVSDPCLIFTLRMKDTQKSGNFITPIPDYKTVHDQTGVHNIGRFEDRKNTPWVTSTPEAQSLAIILNVLGRVGRSENIEVTFPDKEYDRWDAPMFSLGGNWKTMRAFETCNPNFIFKDNAFVLLKSNEKFAPSSREQDFGLLQKMINPSNGLPVWIVMGYRGAGTVSAAYSLSRWWKYLGILYESNAFGLLVAFDDKDGWQQSRIVRVDPKPKWHIVLRHPYAWYMLKKRML